MKRDATQTLIWLALAVSSVALVHADPWQREREAPAFVSSKSAAVRLVPELPEGMPTDLVLEIAGPQGVRTRIEPGPRGPVVHAADELVGPADPEALDGLWASLRAATTLRAVADETEAGLGEHGRIELRWGDERVEILLGRASPDGAGLYGARADDRSQLWVVERELGDIVDQGAEAWAARRPLVVEPADVTGIAFADATLARGLDGLWRSTVGDTTAIVQREAVEARLGRLLAARLDPWLPAPDARDDAEPWMRVTTADGAELPLWLRGPCPDAPDRVVVDRGEGRPGCIDVRLVEPWPLPGTTGGTAWIEPRLLPHAYERVLSIQQVHPNSQLLRRHGGGWVIETRAGAAATITELRESEVFRWYRAMFDARFDTDRTPTGDTDVLELEITTDTTVYLRLGCGAADDDGVRTCRRDDEPALAVKLSVDPAFDTGTFAQRELVQLEPGEARAIEISGGDVVRQSVHLDLGVWRLDAPLHPEGEVALDEARLEELLAAISGARAQAWVATPEAEPERAIRVERVAVHGRSGEVELQLWPAGGDDCIARVGEGRAARVGEGMCATLRRGLLLDGPIEHVLDDARTLVLHEGDREQRLVREQGLWQRQDGDALGPERELLDAWSALRTVALRPGEPRETATATLDVLPTIGEPYTIAIGDGWAQIVGQPWYYVLAPAPDE